MTLTKTESELLRRLGFGAENIKPTKDLIRGLNISERTARGIIQKLINGYHLPIIGIRKENKSGYFIATSRVELLAGLTPFINQITEEQKRLSALSNANPEGARELVRELLTAERG